ncbi:Virus attachment protein p12 family [uncultured Roseburia sp.]|uniref:FeoB-associated Cys-rich membrane protein n=1 Tax=Brotonthovivens ammoniilytica TaxID=2981725 RepID=A0ABT2TME5_9FIRM|nr:FeoB-associated Cys-rich membrane protein [Brotonthovivens ammoniilytica]MCU6762956.1 FeoB-associated Cys-rich membrane protein [Brotonthovivens ammoniilytica]SCI94821.1 Virus attachment protein p12 family [uncultured Roseburia sp.]
MAATIIVALLVVGAVILAVRSLIKDKKSGKSCSGCSGNCAGCHKES